MRGRSRRAEGRPGCGRRAAGSAGLAALLLPCLALPARAGISGVCPDGSIYIVQRAEQIPCSASKQVEPHELPPLRGDYLPRPYGWELHQKRQDQNNPYNLVDLAPSLRLAGPAEERGAGQDARAAGSGAPSASERAPERAEAPLAEASEWRESPGTPAPSLAVDELRGLLQIVELSQESAPARFEPEGDGVELALARSRAFEPRLQAALGARGAGALGPVVLFAARAQSGAGSFGGQLTFVQGHRAFYPDVADPAQIGVLAGALGELRPGEALLGYVVLPADYDPAQEMEVFWHDRQLRATLSPGA